MKQFTLFLICGLFSFSPLLAQLVDCDCGNRYEAEIFNELLIEENVIYSEPYNLAMDIYMPHPDLDVCTDRPLIILAHGGSFICLLYTSDAADEEDSVDLGGRRIIKK